MFILCCVGASAVAQTVTVNATGAVGSYKTGYVFRTSTPTRNDGNIQVKWYSGTPTATAGDKRGWAVFDLSGLIPAGTVVTGATIRMYNTALVNTTNPSADINYYSGDMSTITNPTTIYNNCAIAGQNAWTGNFGNSGTPVTYTYTLNSTALGFLSGYSGVGSGFATFCFVTNTNANQQYTFTGETGTATTVPQLSITYQCTGISAVSASASPVPACAGATLNLNGTALGGDINGYTWAGPAGFSSTDMNTSLTATTAAAGTYTFTAYNSLGCASSSTVAVTVNPSPGAITGNLTPCAGAKTTLSSLPATGTWSINSTSGAVISPAGVVTAGSATGTTTVSYTFPSTGCRATATITTLDTPAAITGPSPICAGTATTYSSTTPSGIWEVNPGTVAAINPTTGILNGIAMGSATVTYTGLNGCRTRRTIAVNVPPNSTITSSTGSFNICPSLSLTLSNTVVGGSWSTSSSNITINPATGMVTGVTLGSAPVTYTNTCGVAYATIEVVGPPPPITGTFSTCVNATTALSNSEFGGIWSSDAPGIAAAAAGFGTVTGVTAGSTTITYRAPSGCYVTTPFTVNPIPTPILGINQACVGFSSTLSDVSPGGVWSTGDAFIATVNATGKVTGIVAANTTITYTYPTTGCYVTIPFTVNPLPVAISGAVEICALKSDTVRNLSLGGSWTSSNSGIAAVNSAGIVSGVTAGTVNITYTLPTGCYRTRSFTVHPLPNAVISYNGVTNTLSTGTFYTSYQWYYNGVPIPGATSPTVAAVDNGSFQVYVTDTFGCEKLSGAYNMAAVGITEVNDGNGIAIAPNPTTGIIVVTAPVRVTATVTNTVGKTVLTQPDAHTLDLGDLANGMYLVTLTDENGRKLATTRIVKQQ